MMMRLPLLRWVALHTCAMCGNVHYGIGGYYERKRCDLRAADAALDAARKRGAKRDEIRQLEEARERAADTGD